MTGYRKGLWGLLIVATASAADVKDAPKKDDAAGIPTKDGKVPAYWLAEQLPLPLGAKTKDDLAYKAATERRYLEVNLLAGGKLAYDTGRFGEAAVSFQRLVELGSLDAETDTLVRSLLADAQSKAGQAPVVLPPRKEAPVAAAADASKPKKKKTERIDVTGVASGGGSLGPSGAVVSLKRKDGKTPAVTPSGEYLLTQMSKQFMPHVLVVPAGATVNIRNDDAVFHNVFSPTAEASFDLGLYKNGVSRTHVFEKAGAVQVLCNIHAGMTAWVVAVDTPFVGVTDGSGRFTIAGVPAGDYAVEIWHEASLRPIVRDLKVVAGMPSFDFNVVADRRLVTTADKYGKARQAQLGY